MFASIDMSMEDAMGLKEALQRLTTAILAHQNSTPPTEGAH